MGLASAGAVYEDTSDRFAPGLSETSPLSGFAEGLGGG
jgi:hypothetical protein